MIVFIRGVITQRFGVQLHLIMLARHLIARSHWLNRLKGGGQQRQTQTLKASSARLAVRKNSMAPRKSFPFKQCRATMSAASLDFVARTTSIALSGLFKFSSKIRTTESISLALSYALAASKYSFVASLAWRIATE